MIISKKAATTVMKVTGTFDPWHMSYTLRCRLEIILVRTLPLFDVQGISKEVVIGYLGGVCTQTVQFRLGA